MLCEKVRKGVIVQKEEPLVSVIIPSYNHQDYVKECIDSIANQTYQNIEIIVIDDGSSDNTYDVVKKVLSGYTERFKFISVQKQENAGTATTWNRLIKKTSGKYIYPIDSDDVSKPTAIQKEVEFLESHPDYGLVVGDNEFIDEDSKRIFYTKENTITYDIKDAVIKTFAGTYDGHLKNDIFGMYYELLKGNHVPNGYLVRSDILKKIEFTSEAPLEDYYMMLQLAKYGKFKYIDEILLSYRRHSTNISKQSLKMADMTYQTLLYEKQIIMNEKELDFSSKLAFFNVIDIKMKQLDKERESRISND